MSVAAAVFGSWRVEAPAQPEPQPRPQPAPLLGAALAFAAGILLASRVWRPPVWWIAAAAFLLGAAAFFYQKSFYGTPFSCKRRWLAHLLCLVALVFLGAVNLQLAEITAPCVEIENDERFARITDGREVVAEAYALRDSVPRASAFGGAAQLVDVAVSNVLDENLSLPLKFSLRLNVYSQTNYSEQAEGSDHPVELQQFLYGERSVGSLR